MREQYTPFGEKFISDKKNDDLGGYAGHISDSNTGLTYMQARYYDPVIGKSNSEWGWSTGVSGTVTLYSFEIKYDFGPVNNYFSGED